MIIPQNPIRQSWFYVSVAGTMFNTSAGHCGACNDTYHTAATIGSDRENCSGPLWRMLPMVFFKAIEQGFLKNHIYTDRKKKKDVFLFIRIINMLNEDNLVTHIAPPLQGATSSHFGSEVLKCH